MNKKFKPLPRFKNEDEEREFWTRHEALGYFDWDQALTNPTFPQLKPSTETISLRLPKSLLEQIKMEAHRQDVPYQSLIKAKLYELFGDIIWR